MSSGRSGLFSDGTVDYDGTIPGWRQGNTAARPPAGLVPGDLYLDNQAQMLYGWTGTAWVVVLGGGGGGSQDIQSVLTVGNVTSQSQVFTPGVVPILSNNEWAAFFGEILFKNNAGFAMALKWPSGTGALTANRITSFPDAGGTIQVSGNGVVVPIRTVTAAYTATRSDYAIFVDATAGAFILTLPVATGGQIFTVQVIAISVNSVTIVPTSGTINNAASLILSSAALTSIGIISDGTNLWT